MSDELIGTVPTIHFATYGEHGADDVPTACGIAVSTWDKPLRYAWEIDTVTCLPCLRFMAELWRSHRFAGGTHIREDRINTRQHTKDGDGR